MVERVIIDTDPGYDDAAMLCFMLNSPKYKVEAITTVFGNASLEITTRNACRILEFLEREDIPIYKGACTALQDTMPYFKDMSDIHGKDGMNNPPSIPLTPSLQPQADCFGPLEIVKRIKKSPGEITLVAIGPLTNIAIALKICPQLPQLVKKVFIMGGCTQLGNTTRWSEYNFYADALSAHQVLSSFTMETVVHIVPWETCLENVIPYSEYNKFFEDDGHTSKEKVLLKETGWSEWEEKRLERNAGYVLADQFIPLALLYPQSVVKTEFTTFDNVNTNKEDPKYGLVSVSPGDTSEKGLLFYKSFNMAYAIRMFTETIKKVVNF